MNFGTTRRSLLMSFAMQSHEPDLELFFRIAAPGEAEARPAMRELSKYWRNGYTIQVVELIRLISPHQRPGAAERLVRFLEERTGNRFGPDIRQWTHWAWSLREPPHAQYAIFKGVLYGNIDPRMRAFFPPGVRSRIPLVEVEWGGVTVNGIPPLRNPVMMSAREAAYLKDSNVVFGIEQAGEAKAYPKRILAWHEMVLDRVGGVDLAIVYCTLCGTVIPYRSEAAGRKFTFGTSGLLYQSSKLMFDEETNSLWPTLQGKPMVGALAGSDLELDFAPVVTTTWGEWRKRYPGTLVLSPNTGHQRDYSEGAAYRDYFSTDELMFDVSRRDRRLKNKDEVLVVRIRGKRPLAIAVRFLEKRSAYEVEPDGMKLTVRTEGGANRVYSGGVQVPAHRAFWFGWYAQYPDTVLIR
jgi:hypothetical protein